MRVFVVGEGLHDIGVRGGHRDDPASLGVVRWLLDRLGVPIEQQVTEKVSNLKARRLGAHRHGIPHEILCKQVYRAAELAQRHGCNGLVFVRDRDRRGPSDTAKRKVQRQVEVAQDRASADLGMPIVAVLAQETIEAWVLELSGVPNAWQIPKSSAKEAARAQGIHHADDYVSVSRTAPLDTLDRRGSLAAFTAAVRATFSGDL